MKCKYRVKLLYECKGSIKIPDVKGALLKYESESGKPILSKLLDKESIKNMEIKPKDRQEPTETDPSKKDTIYYGHIFISINRVDHGSTIKFVAENVKKIGPYPASFEYITIERLRKINSHKYKQLEGENIFMGLQARESKWIILVEGKWDVINLHDAGYLNTLSIGGGNIIEWEFADKIIEICGSKKVVTFFDSDRMGKSALDNVKNKGIKPNASLLADKGEVEHLALDKVCKILRPVAKRIEKELGLEGPETIHDPDGETDKEIQTQLLEYTPTPPEDAVGKVQPQEPSHGPPLHQHAAAARAGEVDWDDIPTAYPIHADADEQPPGDADAGHTYESGKPLFSEKTYRPDVT